MDSPKANIRFSVLIPAFNTAHSIGHAIESIFAQTYPAHEIIVVDDGSADDTAKVVARFGASVRYHRQDNAGVSAARNAAAGLATGEWLTFLDADDWYYPDRLRWHAELLARHPDLNLLSGDYEFWRENGALIERSMGTVAFGLELLAMPHDDVLRVLETHQIASFIRDYFGCTLTLSIPRTLFTDLGGYPVGFPVAEDIHFFVRACARARRIGVVAKPMAAYKIHDRSAVRHDRDRAQREAVRALMDLREALGDAPAPIQQASRDLLRNARLDLATAVRRSRGRLAAVRAAVPLLVEHPGIRTLRDLASLAL